MMKRILVSAAAVLLIGLGASAAMAGDISIATTHFKGGDGSFDRAVSDGFTFGLSNDPPYGFVDPKTNQPDGIDVRALKAMAEKLGIKNLKWEVVQFDALLPGLLAKRWDSVILHENEARRKVVAFGSPLYWYGSALAVQKGNPQDIHSFESLAGKVVGTIRGSLNQQILEARKDIKELKLYTSNDAEFTDLINGRIDVAMEDDFKVASFVKAHPDQNIEMASGYVPQATEYGYSRFTVRLEDVDLNHALSRAADEIRADETMSGILRDFGYSDRNLWYFPTKN
jgi:polar amino acid transport system substrate-binding protein